MPTISQFCPKCRTYGRMDASDGQVLVCPHCQNALGHIKSVEHIFDQCPICQGRQFYIDKDFNQIIGWIFMGIAIILVPFTYGLSLAVFAAIDFLLRKRIRNMVVCYKCGAEYRGFVIPGHFKIFMHHIGLKYDKYR